MKLLASTSLPVVPTSFTIKAGLADADKKDIVQSHCATCNIPRVIIVDELSERTKQH